MTIDKLKYFYAVIPLTYLMFGRQMLGSFGFVSELELSIVYKWGFVLLLLGGVVFFKKMAETGLSFRVDWTLVKLYWPFVLLIAYQFSKVEDYPDAELLFKLGLLALSVGLIEEIFFRGILLYLFRKRSHLQQVLYSAVIFSLAHTLNLLSGFDSSIVVLHLLAAFAIGVLLAILRLKEQSLILVIVTHSLINYSDFLFNGDTGERLLSTQMLLEWIVPSIIFLAWAGYLLSKRKR